MTDQAQVPLELCQLGKEIVAQIEQGDKAERRAADMHLSAGKMLIEARDRVDDFKAFLKEHCHNLQRSRAYQLIAIAEGKTTVEAERAKTAERMRRHRATGGRPSRNGHGTGSGETSQIKRGSQAHWLSEFRIACATYLSKMDAATLAEAQAMVAAWASKHNKLAA